MGYLYIPTTTLNFNNILSTGSISPATLYVARQFGYKQFETVEPNPFRNVLILYDRYPLFDLTDAERDNYPIVIRLRTDRLRAGLVKQYGRKDNVSVYVSGETIYFEPSSAEFLFPSQKVMSITLTKAEPSLTTKLVELFRPVMLVPRPNELDSFTWSGAILEGIKDGDPAATLNCCEADNRINRLKGFASGYVLGAYKSTDPKVARLRSSVRSIRNEVSSRLNDPARNYPKSMRKDVEFSCETLEQFFAEADIGAQRFDPDKGDNIQIITGRVAQIIDRNVTNSSSTQSLVRLLNDYCLSSGFNGQLDEQRMDVAMEGAKAIKALIGSQWEGSAYQKYINALLNNIKNGSEFDFGDSTSLAMQSFAAFILKGDDLDKLEAFLTAQGIGDLRTAFALWGAMFGFSKLPKTLYSLPAQQGDTLYLARIHAYIHSIVHGVPTQVVTRQPVTEVKVTSPDPKPGGEASLALLAQLQQKVPKSIPWHPKIGRMLLASGGLCADFIALLHKTKAPDLGKPIKGVKKTQVEDFFKEALEAQLSGSKDELPLEYKPRSSNQFVDDDACVHELRQIDGLPETKLLSVSKALQEFQTGYKPNGFYSGKPQAYQRDNANAVDHFIRCLSSTKTQKLNVPLSDMEREIVLKWLRNRYEC